jgi:beta-lactamase class C
MNSDSTSEETIVFQDLSALPIPTTSPVLQRSLRNFTSDLRTTTNLDGPPGLSLAVIYQGQAVLTTGFGEADIDQNLKVDAKTVFRVASLSKGFAAVLVGILVDEKILDWDDLVVKYLPDFKLHSADATKQLSIRHLLSHTTGLPRHAYSNLLNQSVPYREIVPMLQTVALAHEPGTWYNYQNVAYSLIGDIVQKATGISYDSLLKERLFIPLGMTNASLGYEKMQENQNAAQPHSPNDAGYHRLEFNNKWYDVSPAAGVNASAHDLSKWLQLMLGHHPEIISKESLAEITKKQIGVSPQENVMRSWKPLDDSGYALGWRTVEKSGRKIVFHGGFVNGYRAEMGFCPEENIGLALLSNGANHFMRNALPDFFEEYFATLDLEIY